MISLTLTPDQNVALEGLLRFCKGELPEQWPAALLQGYAGTGKTTLVGILVRSLLDDGLKVAVTAPTNKAVNVLREKVSDHAIFGTIHSLLGLVLKQRDDAYILEPDGPSSIDDFDVVLVDECSMIGVDLMKFIRTRAKLIFVGDSAQLPPVNEPDSPVFKTVGLRYSLSEIVRQAAENPIIRTSMEIRRLSEMGIRTSLDSLRDLLKGESAACVLDGIDLLETVACEVQEGRDCRVLAWRNETVQRYNDVLYRRFYPDAPAPFTVGQTVIVHESIQYETPLGEKEWLTTSEEVTVSQIVPFVLYDIPSYRVHVVRSHGGPLIPLAIPANRAEMNRKIAGLFQEGKSAKKRISQALSGADAQEFSDRSRKAFKSAWGLKNSFADLRHPWAMTVHKAQGSTFDTVILDWKDLNLMPTSEFNRCLYTAITRPSEYLAIIA